MGLFDALRGRRGPAAGVTEDLAYLQSWSAARTGVEGFVEPETTVTDLTVVLVDAHGEWTRRRVGTRHDAMRLSQRLGIPVYDVEKIGYPQRMRDFDARRRIERRREYLDELRRVDET